MNKKNVALVGMGRWGKNLARNLHELNVLHTICDANEATLDKFQDEFSNVKFTSNYHSVLENRDIKRLMIAAPAFHHYSLAKQALLAGKDIFVEKPLCMEHAQGIELVQLAAEKGLILMVGHLLQYHPYVKHLQKMVALGDLGKLHYIVSNRLNLGAFRLEENALWNFAPHDISVILSLCGDQLPKKVRCTGADYLSKGVADTTMTTLQFNQDIRAHIYVSWLHPFKEQKLIVIGSKGMVVFDDTMPWNHKLALYRDHVTWKGGSTPVVNATEPEWVHIPEEEPLKNECMHFIKCCDERMTPITDGNEGMRVLMVLEAAQASLSVNGETINPGDTIKPVLTKNYFSHPTAIIDPNAVIGMGSKIWHFSHIMDGAIVGEKCNIGQNVVISPKVVIGKNVKVQNNVSLYSGVVCEDDVFLGPGMVFTNILNPRCSIVRRDQYLQTLVRKGATIGANATLLCGIELGKYCFIGAGTVVTKNVPPYALIVGNPGKQIGWMSRFGSRLNLPCEASPGEILTANCPDTGDEYILECNQLQIKSSTHSTKVSLPS